MIKMIAVVVVLAVTCPLLKAQTPAVPVQSGAGVTQMPEDKVMHIGGSVTAPVLIHLASPEYTDNARKKKFNGDVQIYLWVDENGNPTHVRVVKGVGMGLDEKAVEAVRQYKFKPAMKNGKPVKVDLFINVNFQIF